MIERDELRRQAEVTAGERATEAAADGLPSSPGEAAAIVHELRVHQIELEMQNEELRSAQVGLDAERARYFELYDLAPAGYCTVGENGMILEANLTEANLLCVARGALIGQPFSRFILGEDQDLWYRLRAGLFGEGAPRAVELRMRRADGTAFWARLEATAARDARGDPACFVAMGDIDSLKRAEDSLRRSFRENRELLVELQHRAKNSFAMISSMIHMAVSSALSPEGKASLDDLDMRVGSVAELYALLYAAGSPGEVRLDDYCLRVATPLVGLSGRHELVTDLEAITVSIRKAAPLGLIVTELVTNALKSPLPEGRRGTLTLRLGKIAAGALLEVVDDGPGMPAGFDLSRDAGMGLAIVQSLAAQIEGSFRIEGSPAGTRCALEFPLASAFQD